MDTFLPILKNFLINKTKNPLFRGSVIMVVGSNCANIFSYLYHIIMGRLLAPPDYGTLTALISFLTLITSAYNFSGLVIVKIVSSSKQKEINNLFSWITYRFYIFGWILAFLVVITSRLIYNFFGVDRLLVLLLAPIVFFNVINFAYRSFLQGLLRFIKMTITANIGLIGKLIFGVLFIYLGYSVFGALMGILLISIIDLFLLRYFLKDIRFKCKSKYKLDSKFVKYSVSIFLSTFSVYALLSNDLLLVKHYFDADYAGLYAAVSVLGKVIFYISVPITTIMFPLVSKKISEGRSSKETLLLSLLFTFLFSFGVLMVYLFFPSLVIKYLYGIKYLGASKYLFWTGIYMALFTIANLILNYFLSKGETRVIVFVLFSAVVQTIGIILNHNTLFQVIGMSMFAVFLMLIGLISYFIYGKRASIKSYIRLN